MKLKCLLALLFLVIFPTGSLWAAPDFYQFFNKHHSVMLLIEPGSGKIVRANRAASEFYGYPVEQLEKMMIQQINQLSAEQVAEERKLAQKENRSFFIFRHKAADGTIKTVEVHSSPFEFDGRTLLHSIVNDISDKRAVQDELWHYQNRLEDMVQGQRQEIVRREQVVIWGLAGGFLVTLFLVIFLVRSNVRTSKLNQDVLASETQREVALKATGVGIFEWDLISNTVQWDDQMYDIYEEEKTDHSVPYEVWQRTLDKTELKNVEQELSNSIDTGAEFNTSFWIKTSKGTAKVIKAFGVLHRDEFGKPCKMIGINEDITHLVQAESKFKDLLDYAADGIHILDLEGNVVICNQAFADSLGYTMDEALTLNVSDWEEAIPKDQLKNVITELLKKQKSFETKHLRKDGSIIDVQVNAKSITLDGQQYLYASQRVITEIKELQNKLEAQVKSTQAANMAKSVFLANLSHEIRTPMVGIKGIVELLKSSDNLNADEKNLLDDLDNSSDSLLTLLSDILDISKIEAEKLELNLKPEPLKEIVESVHKLFLPLANSKGLYLILEIDHLDGVSAKIDSLRLRQILSNLVGNAVKFTSKGEVRLMAKLQTEADQPTLLIEIVDTGIGLNESQQKKIFEPFAQVATQDRKNRRASGTGLGLTISTKLIDLMKGEISLESKEGIGSTFKVRIPLEIADHKEEGTPSSGITLRPLKILLAEDNLVNQKVVKKMLENHGHTVFSANNGQKAIEIFNTHDLDLILMDMQMPEMDGDDATKIIRQSEHANAKLPIIAFTADALKENRAGYFAAGVDDIVVKPVKWDVLEKVLFRLTSP